MPFRPIQINTTTNSQSGFQPVGDVKSIINQVSAKQDFISRVKGDIQQRGQNVVNEINNPNQNPLLSGLKATAQGFGAIGDVAGEAFKSVAPDLSQKVSDVASAGFNKVTNALSETPLIKGAAQGDTSNIEGVLQGLQSTGDIANNILLAKGTADIGNKAVEGVKSLYKSSMGSVGVLPEQLPVDHPVSVYEKQALNDWKKPVEVNQPGFKKANEIFQNASSRGNDIPKTLVDNKIFLGQNIQDGKYLTSDSADILRTNAGEASKTYLRPALEIADYSTPPTPVTDVIKNAINSIKKDKFIPVESKNTLIERITKLQPELQTQYPDGMTLVNQLDEKILRDMASKYSPVGDIATNLEASKNKAIADALRTSLVEKSPEGVPVDAFQKELSKMYQAADYLDTLNGKKVPQSLKGKLTQTAAKVVGAVTGESLGGGILGGVGGYHLGGILENYFANMSNPFKAQFLENLQKVSPEAFNKIKEYIGVKELQAIMTPKLGPGTPLGTEKNPIITPAPSEATQMEGRANYLLNSGSVNNPSTNITTKVPKNSISSKSTTVSKVSKDLEPLVKEAKKYKSAEEFVKSQPKLYHGGSADIKDIQLGKSNFQKTFYMSENPDYAKSFGGNKSSLNEIMVDSKAKLADLRKPSDDLVKQIEYIISSKPTGKTVRIQKPDGTFLEIPETKGGLSNPVHSSKDILNGIRQGKAYFAEMPEVKNALKKLGYDGMITQESKMGANFGVWNKDILKTKSQLEEIWKKANKK